MLSHPMRLFSTGKKDPLQQFFCLDCIYHGDGVQPFLLCPGQDKESSVLALKIVSHSALFVVNSR